MNFDGFDPKKIDEYSQQAQVLYGKTGAYPVRIPKHPLFCCDTRKNVV